jgi:hypothetical protein
VRLSDDSRHCNTETCYWFGKGMAHVGPCYDGRTPAKVEADRARQRRSEHPEDWGHER